MGRGATVGQSRPAPRLVLLGVPIGSEAYVGDATRQLLRKPDADSLLREITGLRDAQLAYTLLRVCYLPRATYLARNVAPAQVLGELRRHDALAVAALAAIIQEPTEASGEAQAQGPVHSGTGDWSAVVDHVRSVFWDGAAPVAFDELQRQQIALKHGSGGLAIVAMRDRCEAAFAARTIAVIGPVLKALPQEQRLQLMPRLLQLPLMVHTRGALQSLVARGVSEERLDQLLADTAWVQWCQPGDDGSTLADELLAQVPAAAAGPAAEAHAPVRLQAAFCDLLDASRAREHQVAVTALPAQAQRFSRLARLRSQTGKGAMAFLQAPPSHNPHLSMGGAAMREAMRRAVGCERPPTGGVCSEPACNRPTLGVHCRQCTMTGEQTYRHEMLKRAVYDGMRTEAHLAGVGLEDHEPFIARGMPGLAMDLTIPGGADEHTRGHDCGGRLRLGHSGGEVQPGQGRPSGRERHRPDVRRARGASRGV